MAWRDVMWRYMERLSLYRVEQPIALFLLLQRKWKTLLFSNDEGFNCGSETDFTGLSWYLFQLRLPGVWNR